KSHPFKYGCFLNAHRTPKSRDANKNSYTDVGYTPGSGRVTPRMLFGYVSAHSHMGSQSGFALMSATMPQSPSPARWQPIRPMPYAIISPGATASAKAQIFTPLLRTYHAIPRPARMRPP